MDINFRKKKVLWVVNIPLPEASYLLNEKPLPYGGWLVTASEKIREHEEFEISIAFPKKNIGKNFKLIGDKINYYIFKPIKNYNYLNSKKNIELKNIVLEVQPDLVHIFGTELPHCLAMVKLCEELEVKYVISIQGLVSIIEKHLFADLPFSVIYGSSLRNIILRDNISKLKNLYYKRGKNEVISISKANHVIGRTTWDKACVKQINRNIQYHLCNETLREVFYKNQWNTGKYEEYSIFVSQGQLPFKGLHYVLEAMSIILKEFPSAKLIVGGKNLTKDDKIKDKVLITHYGKYIKKIIRNNNLLDKVCFTGELSEKDMCDRLKNANVFVLASSIENSPNSLAEAMILGVPCIASDVGGVPDMITHNKDGFIYNSSAPYMLAYYVCEIFRNKELALTFSKNARRRALITHDPEVNSKKMIEIYENII